MTQRNCDQSPAAVAGHRRGFVVATATLAALPLWSRAQQPNKVWRVGVLLPYPQPAVPNPNNPFQLGLRELGYVEGKNLELQYRFADNRLERLPVLATELVQLRVDAIFAVGTPAVRAAQAATRQIRIVLLVGDPVVSGLVASLARPGGNTTGVSNLEFDAVPKRLELLLAVAPKAAKIGVLVNPANAANMQTLTYAQPVAQRVGIGLVAAEAQKAAEIPNAFAYMVQQGVGALLVGADTLFFAESPQISELAIRHRLPALGGNPEFPAAGGLMSYAPSTAEQSRLAANYVDRIFKGAKPADLPVQQPTAFQLVINVKTARVIGLALPQAVLLRATRLIE